MKKQYEVPDMEIEEFTVEDIASTSSDIDEGGLDFPP